MSQHSILHIVGIILTILMHCTAYTFFLLINGESGKRFGLVNKTESESFKLYSTEMAPDAWYGAIWHYYFPSQFWWLFGVFSQFRAGCNGDYLYKKTSYFAYIFYGIGIGLQVPRLLLQGNDYNLASFFMALLSAILMVAAYVMKAWKPAAPGDRQEIKSQGCCSGQASACCNGKGSDFTAPRGKKCSNYLFWWRFWHVAVSNTFALVAVWLIFYALAILALVLAHHSSPPQASGKDAATGCLSVFLILLIIQIGLELILFDTYCRYQFGSYIATIVAMSSVLSNRYEGGSRNTVLTLVILCLAVIGMIAKIINCCVREHRDRKKQTDISPEAPLEKTNPSYSEK